MKRVIAQVLIALTLVIAPAGLFSGLASAACPPVDTAKGQVLHGVNETGSACSDAGVESTFGVIVDIMSILLGAVAIIMIMVAGFKYITAAGDSGKVGSAKTTLIYALVGVAVAALAQLLVHVVVGQSTKIVQ